MKKLNILPYNGLKKRYKYLYRKMLEEDIIYKAYRKMRKGKTKRIIIRNIDENLDRYIALVKELIYNTIHNPEKGFNPPKHKPRIINEYGKERIIYIPSIIEQWIHHIIMQVLAPIFMKTFHHNSYGSVPGKGLHKGGKLVMKWRHIGFRYGYKLDIRHFYNKIRIDILINQLRRFIADVWMIYIIGLCFKWFKIGLPLGFYLSQWLANVYLTLIDDLIRDYGFEHVRYVDDIIVVSNNKRKLKRLLVSIKIKLGELRLKLKDNYKLFRFSDEAISFLGFVFKDRQVRLRKNIAKNLRAIAKNIGRAVENNKPVWIKNARRITSMMGWIEITDAYTYYLGNIKPYVNIRKMKHMVSKHDKKERLSNYDRMDYRGTRPQARAA